MSSQSTTIVIFFLASILILQCVSAQSSYDDWVSAKSENVQNFNRNVRAGAKFIRFGRAGAKTWDDGYAVPAVNDFYVKRGAKFIRFG